MSSLKWMPLWRGILPCILFGYVLLCISLGGASVSPFARGCLNAIAALGTAALVATWPRTMELNYLRVPVLLVCSVTLIGALQCIPIPVSAWSQIPGREDIIQDLESLGATPSHLPLSLEVEATIASLGNGLIPVFVLILSARVGLRRLKRYVPVFLVGLGFLVTLQGLSQLLSGPGSFLYFYDDTNVGYPVGPFANVNHAGSFLLMMIPFTVFLFRESWRKIQVSDERIATAFFLCAVFLSLITGIVATGSLAVYSLVVPVIVLAMMGSKMRGAPVRGNSVVLTYSTLLLVVIGILIVSTSPISGQLGETASSASPTSRHSIWTDTIEAIRTHWFVGTGMSSFQTVITSFEDPEAVTSTYVVMAHNEYLQILLELGLPGAVLIIFALVWMLKRAYEVWFNQNSGSISPFRRTALIGIFIGLLHSLVDFPARTPAIACVLSLFLAIVLLPSDAGKRSDKRQSETPKHIEL